MALIPAVLTGLSIVIVVSCSTAPAESPEPATATASAPAVVPPSQPRAETARVVSIPAAFDFTLETGSSVEATVTYDAGGVLSATASDGTVFELVVPPHAVLQDTVIEMTPLSDVTGFGEGPVHAVQLEPRGLTFLAMPTLSITPSTPIPVDEQVMFHATSEGEEVIAALVDPASAPVVILVPHLSNLGMAKIAGQVLYLYGQSARALTRLSHEVGQALGGERRRQLAGQPPRPEVWDEVLDLFEQANRDVLGPLKEAALLDCKATEKYLDTLRNIENVANTVGLSADQFSAAVQNEMADVLESAFIPCEREAIKECVNHKPKPDPGILYRFWVNWDRQLTLLHREPKIVQPDSADKAVRICRRALQFVLAGSGTLTAGGISTLVAWAFWGLKCHGNEHWMIWENVVTEDRGSTRTGAPGEDAYGPVHATFGPDGVVRDASWPGAGDLDPLSQAPPGWGTLTGTIFTLVPPGDPTEVHAQIRQGNFSDSAPVETWDGSFGECPDPTANPEP